MCVLYIYRERERTSEGCGAPRRGSSMLHPDPKQAERERETDRDKDRETARHTMPQANGLRGR